MASSEGDADKVERVAENLRVAEDLAGLGGHPTAEWYAEQAEMLEEVQ